jgi:putative hydrolase of the HAD superfamily
MATPVTAVLFDYGMVLSGPPDPVAWARMLAIAGLSDSIYRAAYWAYRLDYDRGTLTGPEYWRAVGLRAGIPLSNPQVTELLAIDNVLWTQPNQPMIDWALRLQSAGIRTGILSNLGDSMTEGVLAALPWLASFDYLLWSHSVKLAKPDPDIYRHALEGLQTAPQSVLFIDDRDENIAGARAAGMQAICYADQEDFQRQMIARGLEELWRSGR